MDERLINAKENGNKVVNFITKNYKTSLMVLFGLFIFYWILQQTYD